jgi:UDP-N-acetylglucosamine 4-epimerase
MRYEEVKRRLKADPKTWLITGVAGFIGSNLLETLLSLEQKVVGLDNFFSGKESNLAEVQQRVTEAQWSRFRFIKGDIRELTVCMEACRNVDFVLHEAAMCSVPGSIDDPLGAHAINTTGTVHLLTAAREARIKTFVYASSSAVYGDSLELPKREAEIGNPLSPYGATKYMDELYAQVFGRCYGLRTVGLRYFNVFGPRQDPNGAYAAVIPKWIDALIHDEPVVIYGDGETTRDFCYIENIIQANVLAACASDDAINQVYNVALNTSTTLNQLFFALQKLLEADYPHVGKVRPIYKPFRAGDIRHSQADIAKSQKLLGYQPTHGIEDGLQAAVGWYVRTNRSKLVKRP